MPDFATLLVYFNDAVYAFMAVVTVASILGTVIPHPAKYDTVLGRLRDVLDKLALGFGHATPATASMKKLMDQVTAGDVVVLPPAAASGIKASPVSIDKPKGT